MSWFQQDLKYALRTLTRSPGYTAAALLSLGLGIGANTAIFTLTNAVFLNPLPVKDSSRLLELYTVDHATRTTFANLSRTPVSYPNLLDIRKQNDVFSGLAAYTQAGVTLTGFGKPSAENLFVVTANYFDVLGVRMAAGRSFRPDEDQTPGGNHVAILSYALAQRLFGSDRAALGRTLNFNSVTYDVIGVSARGFRGTLSVNPPDVAWVPLSMHAQVFNGPAEQLFNERRFRFFNVFGRLNPNVSATQAQAELTLIASRLETAYPKDNRGRTFDSGSLSEAALGFLPRGTAITAALALTAAVGFVLLIACANIANLSLARAAKRAREMGVRVALGAARGRLVRQLLTEAELLSAAGGLLGIGIGWLGARLLWSFRPSFLNQNDIDLSLDLRVCLFTIGVSLLTGLLFGIAPGFRASLPDLTALLNTGGRGNIQGGGGNRIRNLLVVVEMALALVALAGAGLFIRSMQRAETFDLGFESRNLGIVTFDLGSQQMTPERGRQFMRAVLDKAAHVPGVAAASIASTAPLGGGLLLTGFREGDLPDARLGTLTLVPAVTPAYFDTMRIPILQGRPIEGANRDETRRVAVISAALARHWWPGQSAIGKRFHFATSPQMWEVVGVAKDVTVTSIGEPPQPVAYVPFDQNYQPAAVLHVRTTTPPDQVLPSLVSAMQTVNPDLDLQSGTVRRLIDQALWAPRMAAALFGIFGLLGLLLAIVGVYGVMAYLVLLRTSEIGVRIALGARSIDVIRMVVGQSLRLALAGIALGAIAAAAVTRLLSGLLFDISPTDPATFVSVASVLALTALLAAGIPAWRAARINPVAALRQE